MSCLLCVSVSLWCQTKPEELLGRADKALEAKSYSEAETLYRQYLALRAGDVAAQFNLAFALAQQNKRDEAIAAYERTVALDGKLFEARVNLGGLLLEAGRAKDAAAHLAAAVELKSGQGRVHLALAEALLRSGDRAAARMQFDQGLELEPNALAGRLASARLAIEEKDYDRAERDLARAIAANPQDGAMRLELARVYELRGKLDAAAATYREYLAQHPAFAAARRRLGIIYREQKKLDQAIVEFELAYQADPMEEDDWNLARAYTESKKADQALPHWTKLKARHPDNFEAAARLGQMALQKRDYALAQAALLDAIRLDPRVPDPYVDLANVMYLQERYPQTIQVLDRMAAMKVAETPWSAFLRAITLDKLGAAEQALASYQKFLPLAAGKFPDQEFQARQRIKALNQVLEKRGRRRRQ